MLQMRKSDLKQYKKKIRIHTLLVLIKIYYELVPSRDLISMVRVWYGFEIFTFFQHSKRKGPATTSLKQTKRDIPETFDIVHGHVVKKNIITQLISWQSTAIQFMSATSSSKQQKH